MYYNVIVEIEELTEAHLDSLRAQLYESALIDPTIGRPPLGPVDGLPVRDFVIATVDAPTIAHAITTTLETMAGYEAKTVRALSTEEFDAEVDAEELPAQDASVQQ